MGLWADFKKFAFKGNVVDMAVGVVVGGAFGKIVTSLVNDIIMPAVSVLTGGANFADLKYVITPADEAAGISEAAITYGAFIQNIVDFFLIAISVFLFVKLISMGREKLEAKKKAEEEAAAAAKAAEEAAKPKAPTQEELLTEIRLWTHGERRGEGEMHGKSNMETYITKCKIDSQWEFAVWLRKLKQGLCINLEGWNGAGDGREVQKGAQRQDARTFR